MIRTETITKTELAKRWRATAARRLIAAKEYDKNGDHIRAMRARGEAAVWNTCAAELFRDLKEG